MLSTLLKKKTKAAPRDRAVVRSELDALEADIASRVEPRKAAMAAAQKAEENARAALENAITERARVNLKWSREFHPLEKLRDSLRLEMEKSAPSEIDEFIHSYLDGLQRELERVNPTQRTKRLHDKTGYRDVMTHSSYPSIQARAAAIIDARKQALTLRYVLLTHDELIAKLEEIAAGIPEVEMEKI